VAPFHIKAQILRQAQLEPAAALGAFEPRAADGDGAPSATSDKRATRHWRQSEVKRAIAAAEQAGLEAYRVEVAPDGTIAIIVGAPADTAADPNPYRDLLGR
jgi:hypothetical protein